ncbi:MAG: RagB/SusD family nutrient uptake outer membrane protein [Rikenellaceae bacterium]
MKKILLYSTLILTSFAVSSCDDFFALRECDSDVMTEDIIDKDPSIVQGMMDYGYTSMSSWFASYGSDFLDCATDNAVSNIQTSTLEQMVTLGKNGTMTSDKFPLSNWSRYKYIRSVNDFFERDLNADLEYCMGDAEKNARFKTRIRGEALFLRAWNHFEMMQLFAGYDDSGELMGVPYMLSTMAADKVEYLKRNTYKECIDYLVADIDKAVDSLPRVYDGTTDVTSAIDGIGRATTIAALALKSRALLHYASPAFTTHLSEDEIKELYEDAAVAASQTIDEIGSTTLPDIYDISNIGAEADENLSKSFFDNDVNDELILRKNQGNGTKSIDNFPPGFRFAGTARTNPTQNLVDAFPMANGYPITADKSVSGYDPEKMYENRDPRFYMSIIYNKAPFKGMNVEIYPGGQEYSGATDVEQKYTRTGYYLRKWTSATVETVKGNVTAWHYAALIRKVEIFLNLAEAANEAYGPDGRATSNGTQLAMSAREAIAEVRRRAGIPAEDPYLASLTTKDELRELIRNERRIELCFENQRYFDLRRWNIPLDELNQDVKGIMFEDADDTVGEIFTVKADGGSDRKSNFESYMYYGAIPFTEVEKTQGSITQNRGW